MIETSMKWISYQISASYNELFLFNRGNFRKGKREREQEGEQERERESERNEMKCKL